jgi:hypothetical protein
VAALAGIDIASRDWHLKPCKGNYFTASPAPRLRRLVYPVPAKNNVSLACHSTLDLRAGPLRPDSRLPRRPGRPGITRGTRSAGSLRERSAATSRMATRNSPGHGGIRPKPSAERRPETSPSGESPRLPPRSLEHGVPGLPPPCDRRYVRPDRSPERIDPFINNIPDLR